MYVTGSNDSHQLGTKSAEPAFEPIRVAALDMHSIRHAACGLSHTLAVTESGAVLSWGAADLGQLGKTLQTVRGMAAMHMQCAGSSVPWDAYRLCCRYWLRPWHGMASVWQPVGPPALI